MDENLSEETVLYVRKLTYGKDRKVYLSLQHEGEYVALLIIQQPNLLKIDWTKIHGVKFEGENL